MLRPPLLADGVKLVPEMYANTSVCMRLELLGCQIKNGGFFGFPFAILPELLFCQ